MFASLKCVSFCNAHCIPLNGRPWGIFHLGLKWSSGYRENPLSAIVYLLFSQGMRDQMAGRPRLVMYISVGSKLVCWFRERNFLGVWGLVLVLVDKCLCVWKGSKFGFARFRSYAKQIQTSRKFGLQYKNIWVYIPSSRRFAQTLASTTTNSNA